MTSLYDCSLDAELLTGMRLARGALSRGELVVMPTDTVYGIAANAFDEESVAELQAAKGRGREAPPPVLIPDLATLDALADDIPQVVRDLVERFWPGGLTIVLREQKSLIWDLGDTRGTVALRMPANKIALELLADTGPLAVSSANLTGEDVVRTAADAEKIFGDKVAVYLEAGEVGADLAREGLPETSSTIVDATAMRGNEGKLRVLRHGVISDEQLREVVGDALAEDGEEIVVPDDEPSANDESPADTTDDASTDEHTDAPEDEPTGDAADERIPESEELAATTPADDAPAGTTQ